MPLKTLLRPLLAFFWRGDDYIYILLNQRLYKRNNHFKTFKNVKISLDGKAGETLSTLNNENR
jgi:hypothetical protein